MKPTNINIKSLDQYGHTLYLNLSDSIAIYFEEGRPVHVRFWPEHVFGKNYNQEILQNAKNNVASNLRSMGFPVILGDWKPQDIDDPSHGGIIAMITFSS